MASLQDVGLALQLVQNAYGLLRDIANNTPAYKIQAQKDPVRTAEVMKQDAQQYMRRVKFVVDLQDRNPGAFDTAVNVFGLDKTAITDLLAIVQSLADQTSKVDLSDAKAIEQQADAILAIAPTVEKIF